MLNMQGMSETVPRLSNKQRQARGKRKAQGKQLAGQRTKQAKTSIGLRIQLDKARQLVGVGVQSRIMRGPSDIIRPNMLPPELDVRYGLDYWIEQQAKRMPHNSNKLVPNRSKVRVREFSEKLGRVITKTETIEHGGFYRKPIAKPTMLGPPVLFDECQASDDRHWLDTGYQYATPGTCHTNGWQRLQVSRPSKRVAYHQPIGTLPAWKDHRPADYAKLARDMAVAAWRAEKLAIVQEWAAYLAHLGVTI